MEACVRGFSFMPDTKLEVMDLQFIEGGELERTWKTTRRQRLKQQEQKIWDEFVKEQDVVQSVYQDDPYQFLEQLPENCLKDLMDTELQKMKQEQEDEEQRVVTEQTQQQGCGDTHELRTPHTCTVTFADQANLELSETQDGDIEKDKDDCDDDIFHIFDDEKDDEPDNSGTENEALNETLSPTPCTVRENEINEQLHPPGDAPLVSQVPDQPNDSKSSENVSHIIESSIYCAKVKDLRIKINEEMLAIIGTIERQDLTRLEAGDAARAGRRAAEFSTRFNRIYLYQLQRQVQDLKRNYKVSLPFAAHTHFQAQMVRVASLHQNMLQALQVYHKSIEQSACTRESGDTARSLTRAAREQAAACAAVPVPNDLAAGAGALYNDVVLETCDKLDEVIEEYTARATDFFNTMENVVNKTSQKSKLKGKKRLVGTWSKSNSKSMSGSEARLSMYSLETLRLNQHSHGHGYAKTSKDQASDTSKMVACANNGGGVDKTDPPKSNRKSPRCRRGRPLMRAPGGASTGAGGRAGGRGGRGSREPEVRTMVESVQLCASTYISRECSPQPRAPRRGPITSITPITTPITITTRDLTPRKAHILSPRAGPRSPKPIRTSPKPKTPRSYVQSDQDSVATSVVQLSPVSKIHCARREASDSSPVASPRGEGREKRRSERDKVPNLAPDGCEVTRLLRQLCGGDACGSRNERISGAKNAQLLCINGGGSPRQPSTPQLLRILEETIQKKVPKQMFQMPRSSPKDADRLRLAFNISEQTASNLFQYRTKFVQHMLTSPMYANSVVGKPWEMIGSISDQIIDELLLECAKEMELENVIKHLYESETH